LEGLIVAYFVGILDGRGKTWGVRVPDLPGLAGAGSSPENAMTDAISAAREWAAHHIANGHVIPKPRPTHAVIADPDSDYRTGEALVMVPLVIDSGLYTKANISIDAGQLAAIDAEAKRRGLTRSAFMATAALEKIEKQ
jgi:predicted RNase H-like HicB family nuclease